MRKGQGSKTAARVAMYRAFADRLHLTPRFADPIAREWLREPDRRRTLALPDAPPQTLCGRWRYGEALAGATIMASRSVEVDDAIRAASNDQLVILGAGYDTRAWRLNELSGTTVFEVDHPDTQRAKRSIAQGQAMKAKAVHFVPVDFTCDSLDDALDSVGHDGTRPTTWIWEGVVMYLTRANIESTLRTIAKRSADNSQLVIVYIAPSLMMLPFAALVMVLGEPLRSTLGPVEMSALLARYGFRTTRDVTVAEVARSLSLKPAVGDLMLRHLRVVTAARATR